MVVHKQNVGVGNGGGGGVIVCRVAREGLSEKRKFEQRPGRSEKVGPETVEEELSKQKNSQHTWAGW